MNKLTAEICKAMIDECKALKERGYLSINGEFKLQALEIALPILEQQERGEGEWIEWGGGECPVDARSIVEVRMANGEECRAYPGNTWVWQRGIVSPASEITAYRVVKS